MQVTISKTVFNRCASFEAKASMLSQLLAFAGKRTLDIKVTSESWGDVVKKLVAAGGEITKNGASIKLLHPEKFSGVEEETLLITIDDEFIVDCIDAYEDFVSAIIPMIAGFVTGLKAVATVFEGRMKTIQKKWKVKVAAPATE